MISTIRAFALLTCLFLLGGCYSFRDVSIPPEVKTVRINFIQNKARYVNPQLAPQLTDKLRQKVISQTRLTQIQGDDAHYEVSAVVTDYAYTTAGIANQTTATNRLSISVMIGFQNRLDATKNFEAPITRTFDFSADLSIQQAETQLNENIIRNLTDEIFNRIFSNW